MTPRLVQIELLPADAAAPDGWAMGQAVMVARGRREFRPVTLREWTAIERKCSKPFRSRWPKPRKGWTPPARLEDGRTVAEALDSRRIDR